MSSSVILITKISSINMFNHEYERFNAENLKKQCTLNDFYSKTER
jgi:hypothetical protein